VSHEREHRDNPHHVNDGVDVERRSQPAQPQAASEHGDGSHGLWGPLHPDELAGAWSTLPAGARVLLWAVAHGHTVYLTRPDDLTRQPHERVILRGTDETGNGLRLTGVKASEVHLFLDVRQ
jgi:hypothetical protein